VVWTIAGKGGDIMKMKIRYLYDVLKVIQTAGNSSFDHLDITT